MMVWATSLPGARCMKFVKEYFLPEDKDLNVYQNIQESVLYAIESRPALLSYNDAKKWEFSHLDKESCTILNEIKQPIASLKVEDIHI
jgi:hypothetical protein